MSYMDRLQGSRRTNAPVVKVATIDSRRAANRVAEARHHSDYVDSQNYRDTRSLMSNRYGVCG